MKKSYKEMGCIIMPFCPNCGKEINKSAMFCSSCGKALNLTEPIVIERNAAKETQQSTKISKPLQIIIIILAVIIFGGYLVSVLTGNTGNKK